MATTNLPFKNFRQRGFSLTELVVVLLVVCILCVIAVSQITNILRTNRVNTVNAAIAAKLSEARIQAIKRNTTAALVINFQTRKISVESGGTQIGTAESYTSDTQVSCTPGLGINSQSVTFNSFGNLQDTPVSITVSDQKLKLKKSVQVSLSGRISVEDMQRIVGTP